MAGQFRALTALPKESRFSSQQIHGGSQPPHQLKFKGIRPPLLNFSGTARAVGAVRIYTLRQSITKNKSIMKRNNEKPASMCWSGKPQSLGDFCVLKGQSLYPAALLPFPLSVAPFLPATQAGCPKVKPQLWMLPLHHPRCQQEEQQK